MSSKIKKLGVATLVLLVLIAGTLSIAVVLELLDKTTAIEAMIKTAIVLGIVGVVAISIIAMLNTNTKQ